MKVPAAVLVFLLCVPLLPAQGRQPPRIVMVVAPKDFNDQELADPRAVFEKAGALVRIASTSREAAISHNGVNVAVDLALGELVPGRFDALVIVGGTGALGYLMDHEALRNLIVSASRSGKVVAAICLAPAVLAHAGVLRNIPATCYPDQRVVAILKLNGADYRERHVVVAGRMVTADGPSAAEEFARGVLTALKARE